MTRNSIPPDTMASKKNNGLSTACEDEAWVDCVVNKQARPISQAVVKQMKIRMKARKLCKRNNVLNCEGEKLVKRQMYWTWMVSKSWCSKCFKNAAKSNISWIMLVVLVVNNFET